MPSANLSKNIYIPIAAAVETTIENLPKTSVFYDTVYIKELASSKTTERVYITDLEDSVEIVSATQALAMNPKSVKAKDYIEVNLNLASNVFTAPIVVEDYNLFELVEQNIDEQGNLKDGIKPIIQDVMDNISGAIVSKIDSTISNKFKEHSTEIDVPTTYGDKWITGNGVFQPEVFNNSVREAFKTIGKSKFGFPPNARMRVILPSVLQTTLPYCDVNDQTSETALEYLTRINKSNKTAIDIVYSEKLTSDAIITTVKDKKAYIGGISQINKDNIENFVNIKQHPFATEISCSMAFDMQVFPEYYDGSTAKTYKSILLKDII